MKRRCAVLSSALGLAVVLAVCSPTPRPDHYPPGTRVTFEMTRVMADEPIRIQLGPRSSQLFLDMLARPPVHSEVSRMPALPYGRFTVGEAEYLWHGNAVIRGKGRDERLWYGPFLQRLIQDVKPVPVPVERKEIIQSIFDALEQDPTVADTPLQGPGQYPGGANDALLRPSRFSMDDTNGWKVSYPDTGAP
ncbi:MAG: hypothetical protein H7A46_15710 [Verrucomicrobiales bacterium]|nr:hypothetical protein [Verrucomicrobiales bacterium]